VQACKLLVEEERAQLSLAYTELLEEAKALA